MAKEQHEVLDGMHKKMQSLFTDTANYFSFDPKKYTMEDFFTDLKTFIKQFTVSLQCKKIPNDQSVEGL